MYYKKKIIKIIYILINCINAFDIQYAIISYFRKMSKTHSKIITLFSIITSFMVVDIFVHLHTELVLSTFPPSVLSSILVMQAAFVRIIFDKFNVATLSSDEHCDKKKIYLP